MCFAKTSSFVWVYDLCLNETESLNLAFCRLHNFFILINSFTERSFMNPLIF
jgi:hypothetical protein